MRKQIVVLNIVMATLASISASIAHGAIITTTWNVAVTSQYDYASGQSVPISVPSNFNIVISFPDAVTAANDYGNVTITSFGSTGDTSFTSPLSAYVGADPFGSGIDPTMPYTFPNVSDYSSTFVEEFASQGNTHHPSGSMFWDHHISLRATRRSPTMGGTGTADYAFTKQSLLDFLGGVKTSPGDFSVTFSETWELYDSATSSYSDGVSWSGNATLTSVSDSNVPEPSTYILFTGLILCFGLACWWRKRLLKSA